MKEDLVSRELALKLKENGFDGECLHYFKKIDSLRLEATELHCSDCELNWNNSIDCVSMPAQTLAQKWFRERKDLSIEVWYSNFDESWAVDVWYISTPCEVTTDNIHHKTHEEALEYGLNKAMEALES